LAIGTEQVLLLGQCSFEFFQESWPADITPDGIDQECLVFDTNALEKELQHLEHFSFDGWIVRAKHLSPDLMKLPIAPFLRTLAAKHGTEVVQLGDGQFLLQLMLHMGAHDGGRSLWPQRERFLVAILKRVHLFRHNIRVFSHTTRKQFGALKDRSANLGKAVQVEDLAGGVLHTSPECRLWGEDIAGTFDGLDHCFGL
jgi:hypothetical protein